MSQKGGPFPTVSIHYLRPPAREQVFRQRLLYDGPEVKITFARGLALQAPMLIAGEVALENGSDVLWFTFAETWHDIGLFHKADGAPTGLYANILTPPIFLPGHVWQTTDLFLDLWLPPEGRLVVLDREEFDRAVEAGWIDNETRAGALAELERIISAWERGSWPPPLVETWSRESALQMLSQP